MGTRRILPLILAALDGFELTAPQIAERTGTAIRAVEANLRKCEGKLVRVVDYEPRPQGPAAPLWSLGAGRSKPRPPPKTVAQRSFKYGTKCRGLIRARQAKAAGRLNPYAQLMQN